MTRWFGRALAALAASVVLGFGAAAAQVPDPFARQLAQRLAQADSVQGDFGYSRAAGPFAGGLAQGGERRFQVMLRAGQPYRAVGVCDTRCGDLDLRLYDPNGTLVAQDARADAAPMIQINPVFTGTHTIEVAMARCAAEPCYFAFNVYSRQSGDW